MRSSIRKAAVAALVVLLSTPSLSAAQTPPDDGLPEDDGPPPEEYTYNSGLPPARRAGDEYRLNVAPPPPVDNAFPISGALRSACSDSFGDPRSGGRTHMGVDCFGTRGTPLVAVEDGTIRYATPGGPYSCSTGGDGSGNRVSVRGNSGYVYYYGHLDTILVSTGQPIAKGQVVGTMGNTGNALCSGVHVHFEMKYGENGNPFDPYPWIASWGVAYLPNFGWPSTEMQGAGVWRAQLLGRDDLFVLNQYRALTHRGLDWSRGLSPWAYVGGESTSDPDATAPRPDYLPYVFVRGTDTTIWQLYWNGSAWASVNLGGNCTSGPSAAYAGPTQLDLFCRGPNLALYQRAWNARTGWTNWSMVGGSATSDPDVVSPGPGFPSEVLVRGSDSAAHILYRYGGRWFGESLGGNCTSGVSGAYSGPDRLDVFCRGTDMALWHKSWLSWAGWSGWQRIDSYVVSDPEAVSVGTGAVAQVYARGVDDQMYQFAWNGAAFVSYVWGAP